MNFSYGRVTSEMEEVMARHVRGKEVWDLGAGNLGHAHNLTRLGAKRVLAIDKAPMPKPRAGVETHRAYFEQVEAPPEGLDVAFLAWPVNHAHVPGLVRLLAASRTVLYLGSNVQGCACGGVELFRHLIGRPVLEHVPHAHNSLIVYGEPSATPRRLVPEEWAATHPDTIWTIESATEALVRQASSTVPDTFWK